MKTCDKCNSTDDVSFWSYQNSTGQGYYCVDCGSKPYIATFKVMGIMALIIFLFSLVGCASLDEIYLQNKCFLREPQPKHCYRNY